MTRELLQQAMDALVIAEAGLADIGDADREPGDDLAWCEARAAQALELPRKAIAALRAALAQPTPAEYAQGYAEGFNDGCKPAQPVAQRVVAWMTEDGRVATDVTKQGSMSTSSKVVFNIPLCTLQAIAQPKNLEGLK